jgi:hypothetical protein
VFGAVEVDKVGVGVLQGFEEGDGDVAGVK